MYRNLMQKCSIKFRYKNRSYNICNTFADVLYVHMYIVQTYQIYCNTCTLMFKIHRGKQVYSTVTYVRYFPLPSITIYRIKQQNTTSEIEKSAEKSEFPHEGNRGV